MLSNNLDSRDEGAASGDDVETPEQDRLTREFYYLNFLSVFGGLLPTDQIERISAAATESRGLEREGFRRRLSTMLDEFQASRSNGAVPEVPAPALDGWDAEKLALITALRDQGHGLLLGLFHFGAHRQVLPDLAALGLPVSAPIAGKAYWDMYALREQAPPEFAERLKLLEVEKKSVGRELLVDLRRGRLGALYVDGNMGPDGSFVEEGAVEIGFLGKPIKVKAGIARLSLALGAPILPLFCTASMGGQRPRVMLGESVFPVRQAARGGGSDGVELESTMSALYSQLETHIRSAPVSWEYGFCLHRWSKHVDRSPAGLDEEALQDALRRFDAGSTARANALRVARVGCAGQPTWVDVEDQRAYRFPEWFDEWNDRLHSEGGVSIGMMHGERTGAASDAPVAALLQELVRKQLVVIEVGA